MSEHERTIIRVTGLALHGAGLAVLVIAILAGSWALGWVGLLAFVVGGAWGWGMVVSAAKETERERQAKASHTAYLERTGQAGGFTARFDDEAEPLGPPPGAAGASMPVTPVWPGEG